MNTGNPTPNNLQRSPVVDGIVALAMLLAVYVLLLTTIDTGGMMHSEVDQHVCSYLYEGPQQRSDEGSPEHTSSSSLVMSDVPSCLTLSSSIDSPTLPHNLANEEILPSPQHLLHSIIEPFPEPLERSWP